MFGSYGGMMRGGNTEATLVIADGDIGAPPTVAETWSAIFMHHDFSEPTRAKLRPGSLVLVNTTVFEGSFDGDCSTRWSRCRRPTSRSTSATS